MEKIHKQLYICIAILFICFIGISYIFGLNQGTTGNILGSHSIFSNHISTNCDNQSFRDTVNCVNNNFTSWFNYNISNTGKDLTEEELKRQGGVCTHASEWYVNEFKRLGLNAKEVTFLNASKNGHAMVVVYNSDVSEYCMIDQTFILSCINLGR